MSGFVTSFKYQFGVLCVLLAVSSATSIPRGRTRAIATIQGDPHFVTFDDVYHDTMLPPGRKYMAAFTYLRNDEYPGDNGRILFYVSIDTFYCSSPRSKITCIQSVQVHMKFKLDESTIQKIAAYSGDSEDVVRNRPYSVTIEWNTRSMTNPVSIEEYFYYDNVGTPIDSWTRGVRVSYKKASRIIPMNSRSSIKNGNEIEIPRGLNKLGLTFVKGRLRFGPHSKAIPDEYTDAIVFMGQYFTSISLPYKKPFFSSSDSFTMGLCGFFDGNPKREFIRFVKQQYQLKSSNQLQGWVDESDFVQKNGTIEHVIPTNHRTRINNLELWNFKDHLEMKNSTVPLSLMGFHLLENDPTRTNLTAEDIANLDKPPFKDLDAMTDATKQCGALTADIPEDARQVFLQNCVYDHAVGGTELAVSNVNAYYAYDDETNALTKWLTDLSLGAVIALACVAGVFVFGSVFLVKRNIDLKKQMEQMNDTIQQASQLVPVNNKQATSSV